MALNGGMIDELEGIDRGVIDVWTWNLPCYTEVNHDESHNHTCLCPGWNSNRVPPLVLGLFTEQPPHRPEAVFVAVYYTSSNWGSWFLRSTKYASSAFICEEADSLILKSRWSAFDNTDDWLGKGGIHFRPAKTFICSTFLYLSTFYPKRTHKPDYENGETVASERSSVLQEVTPFSPVDIHRKFWVMYSSPTLSLLLAGYVLGLLFGPENGNSTFLWNAAKPIPDYTASRNRR
jgi:hypothetical protein